MTSEASLVHGHLLQIQTGYISTFPSLMEIFDKQILNSMQLLYKIKVYF